MQFLKMLLLALTVGFAVAFAINNWTVVSLQLWGGLIADVNLPLLVLAAFLLGLVPMWVAYRATRWRLRQRLATCERTIADLRTAAATSVPAALGLIAPADEPATFAEPSSHSITPPAMVDPLDSPAADRGTDSETRL